MEFNLSKKAYFVGEDKPLLAYEGKEKIPLHFREKDVKEFIRRLKKDFLVKEYKDFTELIDKLAGDALIDDKEVKNGKINNNW